MSEVLSQDEIDALLSAINSGSSEADMKANPPADTRKIKIYDFRRPDKFSGDQIQNILHVHDTFARLATAMLSSRLRSLVSVRVSSIDQLTYEEFLRSIPNPTMLGIVSMYPLKGQAVLEIDPTITFSFIDRLFGGSGEGPKTNREITDIEKSAMEALAAGILDSLKAAWNKVASLNFRLSAIETNPQFAGIVPPSEMVILVTLDTQIGEVRGVMNLCIPYLTLEPVLSRFSSRYWYSAEQNEVKSPSFVKESISLSRLKRFARFDCLPWGITARLLSKWQKGKRQKGAALSGRHEYEVLKADSRRSHGK